METIGELLERLARGADAVESEMAGASAAEIDHLPAPGRWTIRQIAAHLADSEMVYADRFRRVIAEDNPTLIACDEKAWAAKLDYDRRDPAEDVETFRRVRTLNVRLLRSLPAGAFERSGTHSERGRVTLLDLAKINADHAEGHARQIRGNREAARASRG